MKIFLFLILLSGAAISQPLVNEDYIYYSVSPQSTNDIIDSLNEATPINEHGEPFHAYTNSYITWNFRWKSKNKMCRITTVSVSVDVRYTLPKLIDAPPKVVNIWDSWYPKVIFHENGHKNNAVKVAQNIESGIYNLKASKNCKSLERKANQLGNRFIRNLSTMDKNYDKKTNHGETQGAWIYSHL